MNAPDHTWPYPHCHDRVELRAADRDAGGHALVGAVKDAVADVRRHLAVCESFLSVAGEMLTTEAERYVRQQCDFTRSVDGAVFRCRNSGCLGHHMMYREEQP